MSKCGYVYSMVHLSKVGMGPIDVSGKFTFSSQTWHSMPAAARFRPSLTPQSDGKCSFCRICVRPWTAALPFLLISGRIAVVLVENHLINYENYHARPFLLPYRTKHSRPNASLLHTPANLY